MASCFSPPADAIYRAWSLHILTPLRRDTRLLQALDNLPNPHMPRLLKHAACDDQVLDREEGHMGRVGKDHSDGFARTYPSAAFDDRHHTCLADDRRGRALRGARRRSRLVGRRPVGSRQHDFEEPGLQGVDLGAGVA